MKKYLVPLLIILVVIIFYFLGAKLFSPGSYPNAERYHLNADEAAVVAAVERFRDANPEYRLPEDLGPMEGRADANDYWYHFYLYYARENQIVHMWVRQSPEGGSTLAFVSVSDRLTLGSWQRVNQDFGFFENRQVIKTFETRILDPIKSNVENSK